MEQDVVVVGGGAIGVTAAYELARRGLSVTLLERSDALAAACSAGNAGLICPSHSQPLATPAALREGARSLLTTDSPLSLRPRSSTLQWLARFAAACRSERAHRGLLAIRSLSLASLDLHAELAALETSFERRGILTVYRSEEAFAAGREEAGIPALDGRALPAEEARELEPALGPGIAGAVFFPREGHVDPQRYVQAVGDAAVAAGAELRMRTEARALRRRNGGVEVVTAETALRPKTVVLAAGAWTAKLARDLGIVVPLTGGKGYHVDLEPTAADPAVPILIQGARCAVTPLAGRLRLTGTLEVSGLDPSISQRRVKTVRRSAAEVLAAQPDRRVIDVWAGLRPCTPDGVPVIGQPERVPGLILATGHAMKGISLAPVTARLVAELVADERPSHELAPFSPDRFRPLLRSR